MRSSLLLIILFISGLVIAQSPALMPYQAVARGGNGQPLANTSVTALKTDGTVEESTSLWYAPNTGATNASGFSAVPGGYRSQFGFYTQKGYSAYYWAGQSAGSNDGWFQQLQYDQTGLTGNIFDGRFGASVRCIRDL